MVGCRRSALTRRGRAVAVALARGGGAQSRHHTDPGPAHRPPKAARREAARRLNEFGVTVAEQSLPANGHRKRRGPREHSPRAACGGGSAPRPRDLTVAVHLDLVDPVITKASPTPRGTPSRRPVDDRGTRPSGPAPTGPDPGSARSSAPFAADRITPTGRPVGPSTRQRRIRHRDSSDDPSTGSSRPCSAAGCRGRHGGGTGADGGRPGAEGVKPARARTPARPGTCREDPRHSPAFSSI